MSIRILTLATAAATTSAWAAAAQRNRQQLAGGGPMPMADSLPEECRTAERATPCVTWTGKVRRRSRQA
jgi:hypothetical protein